MLPSATIENARTVVVSHADMMRFHDADRIQAYCKTCEKYGRFWSCPPFEAQPLAVLPAWTCAVLVTQKTRLETDISNDDLIQQFLTSNRFLSDFLLQRETKGATAIVAGHCSGCTPCTRDRGAACCTPARLRYSLEALGFDVTALAEKLAGQAVPWPKDGRPDRLIIVGALLCRDFDLAHRLAA